ncbi:probable E3 ubiquitin-protein ligase HERC4 [Denticeps clupeoides]|uniref:probable E3 ubiquitin-protein ligase HERC4 n=1 Tax=Denticeps clupeoides TaxID=299321 RepID=UPI0010A49904|nr:probable E3 ubiquitin-protein ligase HERC4 [Denticeps clupeoides]
MTYNIKPVTQHVTTLASSRLHDRFRFGGNGFRFPRAGWTACEQDLVEAAGSSRMFCWGEVGAAAITLALRLGSSPSVHLVPLRSGLADIAVGGPGFVSLLWEDGTATAVWTATNHTAKRKPVQPPPNEELVALRSSAHHLVGVSAGGKIIEWNFSNGIKISRTLNIFANKQIVQVSCGEHHSVAFTRDGDLFTWGHNCYGQLGQGREHSNSVSPQCVQSLKGIPLAQVSAGGNHSFALSSSGAVFGWGRNSAGQLGLGDNADRDVPVLVENLNLKKSVQISCGAEHTAVLTKGALVFTFGSGGYGQLGHNSFKDELRPRLVSELWGSEVFQIACGSNHTLAFVGKSKKIYSFGRGKEGQLGSGQTANQCVPLLVHISQVHSNNSIVASVIAGGNQSFALLKSEKASNHPNKGIWTLDLDTATSWTSGCDSKWKKIQKEIRKTFSSVSCINGSFLQKSSDKHYGTSGQDCGLDLSIAQHFFKELSSKEKVLTKVEEEVGKLLRSLKTNPAGVEGLRIYLILPELLRQLYKMQQGVKLAVELAEAIFRLHPDSQKVLESHWSSLPYPFFRSLVKMFRSVSVHLMAKKRSKDLMKTAELMQRLYAINNQRDSKVKASGFYINKINQILGSLHYGLLAGRDAAIHQMMLFSLSSFHCIFDLGAKQQLFCLRAKQQQNTELNTLAGFWFGLWPDCNNLRVNRQTLLTDTFAHLKNVAPARLVQPLRVTFVGENGSDYGGLSQEFFRLFAKNLVKENCIKMFKDSGLVWFNKDCCTSEVFYYVGIVLGMALYNMFLVNFNFPPALFKKLLGLKPTLADLAELSPHEARALKDLLEWDDEDFKVMEQDFTVNGQELMPNGNEILVTKVNRQEFVNLYVDYVFNKSVACQFEAFYEGFEAGCPVNIWKMFLPGELMALLCGDPAYEWEELPKNATYINCRANDVTVQNFWAVFFGFSEEDKKKFLEFLCGTDLIPQRCLGQFCIGIEVEVADNPDDYFPKAATCSKTLQLYSYSTISVLREKLTHAIYHCDEFGNI